MRRYFLPALAFLGAITALFIVFLSQRAEPVVPILFPPPKSPYAHAIAGAGIIEASSRNIAVGSPFNEIVTKVHVIEGDYVKKGDPLFELDLRAFQAILEIAQTSLTVANSTLDNAQIQYSFYERLRDPRAVSEQSNRQTYYSYINAERNLKLSEANVLQAEINIDRSTIRAPVDGQILQVNIHVGEIAAINPAVSSLSTSEVASQGSLILMGTVDPLQIRIDIDEDEVWRYQKGASATAFVRGNSHINFPLEFVRIEPYMIPKVTFTGDIVERLDTRVLQVLYGFKRGNLPIYVGQVLDIFIEAPSFEAQSKSIR